MKAIVKLCPEEIFSNMLSVGEFIKYIEDNRVPHNAGLCLYSEALKPVDVIEYDSISNSISLSWSVE